MSINKLSTKIHQNHSITKNYKDPRCAFCLGSVFEKPRSSVHSPLLYLPPDIYIHTRFDPYEKIDLTCNHTTHLQCLLVSLRTERLFFLKRFLTTIMNMHHKTLAPEVAENLIRNAWHSDSPPQATCKICNINYECTNLYLRSLCCVPPPSYGEVSEGFVGFTKSQKEYIYNIFHDTEERNMAPSTTDSSVEWTEETVMNEPQITTGDTSPNVTPENTNQIKQPKPQKLKKTTKKSSSLNKKPVQVTKKRRRNL